ncbi:MAG TPA: 50S ribosomal protein L11 methyltransferase [Verrucomicrobiae bacterium]|nr:50S ribosomal protein L11 methyltransferase [Verrucomicrobiae bacterium]
MKSRPLWKFSVKASETTEEALAELVSNAFGQPASTYTDLRTGKTTVSVYIEKKPYWPLSARRQFAAALRQIDDSHNRKLAPAFRIQKIRFEDWAESWKRHFKPISISGRLLIRPTWSKSRAKANVAIVQLDPGMSFGTGHHPTTGFCLRQIVRLRRGAPTQSVLDAGTGSGILAICAAKLGYGRVDAFDFDIDCVKAARSNAALNHVARSVRVRQADVAALPLKKARQYSVVCANLMANLLLQHKARLCAAVEAGGSLVLAGILDSEFPQIEAAYSAHGFKLTRSRGEKEWRSGCFLRTF